MRKTLPPAMTAFKIFGSVHAVCCQSLRGRLSMLMAILVVWLLHNAGDNQWLPMAVRQSAHQIPVHPSDELERYLFRADRRALAMIGATAKVFVGHRGHH